MLKDNLEGVTCLDVRAMAQLASSLSGVKMHIVDDEAEQYVIISNAEKADKGAHFALVAGVFEEELWSGVMLVSDAFLSENAALLESLQAHLKRKNENIALNAESCVFAEDSEISEEYFAPFIERFCKDLSKNLALSATLNATISDFALKA